MATATKESTSTETEAESKQRQKSDYVVLQVLEGNIVPIGTAQALNDIQAIGEVASENGIEEGEFLAVPQRSWRVRAVSVRTRRSVQVK